MKRIVDHVVGQEYSVSFLWLTVYQSKWTVLQFTWW